MGPLGEILSLADALVLYSQSVLKEIQLERPKPEGRGGEGKTKEYLGVCKLVEP